MPMPALTFMHRTIHSSQNWGVFQAVSTETALPGPALDPVAAGCQPSGFQSAEGTRTSQAPKSIQAA